MNALLCSNSHGVQRRCEVRDSFLAGKADKGTTAHIMEYTIILLA